MMANDANTAGLLGMPESRWLLAGELPELTLV